MTSQALSEIYNYAAFSYEYYNAATQTPHGQVNQHMTELQPDTTFYGKSKLVFFHILAFSVVCGPKVAKC